MGTEAARDIYDPVRDLAAVLHGALRQGSWGPAVRGALARLEAGLDLTAAELPSDVEASVRARLDRVAAWRRAMDFADWWEAQDPVLMDMAVRQFRRDQPEKAKRLCDLLTGQARPAWQDEASA